MTHFALSCYAMGIDSAYAIGIECAPMMSAAQVRKAREELGMSQIELARRLRCNQSTVSRWEEKGITERFTALAVKQLLDQLRLEAA